MRYGSRYLWISRRSQEDMALAVDWRRKTREIFETYLHADSSLLTLRVRDVAARQRDLYTLWRPPADWLTDLSA